MLLGQGQDPTTVFQGLISNLRNLFLDLFLFCEQGWSEPSKDAGPRPCGSIGYEKHCWPIQGLDTATRSR